MLNLVSNNSWTLQLPIKKQLARMLLKKNKKRTSIQS